MKFLILFVFLLHVLVSPVLAQDDPVIDTPGTTEDTGTYFEIIDSEFLNVTLDSTSEVHAWIESFPEVIVLYLESTDDASQTILTLGGLDPSTTYYKFEDGYENGSTFTTDANGRYTYNQNLDKSYLVIIQTQPGTILIPQDLSVGTWDSVSRIYTLNTNVYETVQITENNLTLDGNGYSIIGTGSVYAILANSRSGIKIRNVTVDRWWRAIYLINSNRFELDNNTVINNRTAIYLRNSPIMTITNNILSDNWYGLRPLYSYDTSIIGNTISNNSSTGIWSSYSPRNTISENGFYNNYRGINVWLGDNSLISQNIFSGNNQGIYPAINTGLTISHNTIENSIWQGLIMDRCENNIIYNNNFINNGTQAYLSYSSNNLFDLPLPIGGNYWSNWTQPDNNNDGIVDLPYITDSYQGHGQDNLPWTIANGWPIPPVAVDDTAVLEVGDFIVIDVLANDYDPNEYDLNVTDVTQSTNGAVVNNSDGTVTYTRNRGFNGVDTFTYTISNGTYTSSALVTVTVTVEVNVASDATLGIGVTIGAGSTVGSGAVVGDNVVIGTNVTIDDMVTVGDGTTIGNSTWIKDGASVGDDVVIAANVTIGKNTTVGDNTSIGEGALLKQDVSVGTDVTLGTNITLGKAVIIGDRTSIGDRTQINSLTQIGTDCTIGTDTQIGRAVTIGSNVTIGNYVLVKNKAVIPDDSVIPDNSTVP